MERTICERGVECGADRHAPGGWRDERHRVGRSSQGRRMTVLATDLGEEACAALCREAWRQSWRCIQRPHEVRKAVNVGPPGRVCRVLRTVSRLQDDAELLLVERATADLERTVRI